MANRFMISTQILIFLGFGGSILPKATSGPIHLPLNTTASPGPFSKTIPTREKRAVIACAEISPQGELESAAPCLDHPGHHYSYPHIFRAGSEIFMIPESLDSKSVDLFRCQQFPDKWVRELTLLKGKFVDTTIWEHEGLWWMTTTSATPSSRAGSLLLFYSTSPTGEWHFHPANPISTDIRNNRGAGRVFRSYDRLVRPSQSGAPTYGYAIAYHEITELSIDRYCERHLRTITPRTLGGTFGQFTATISRVVLN